jgi:hypothetical protein
MNRSIEEIEFMVDCCKDEGMLLSLILFVQNNLALECLCTEHRSWGNACHPTLHVR